MMIQSSGVALSNGFWHLLARMVWYLGNWRGGRGTPEKGRSSKAYRLKVIEHFLNTSAVVTCGAQSSKSGAENCWVLRRQEAEEAKEAAAFSCWLSLLYSPLEQICNSQQGYVSYC